MSRSIFFGASILIVLFTLFSIIGLSSYYSSVEPAQVAVVETPQGHINLSLFTPYSYLVPQQSNDLVLTIHSDGHATGISAEFSYDREQLQVLSVTQGDFFANTLSAAKIANGKVTFTYVVPPDSGGKQGEGTVATIKVKPTTTTPSVTWTMTDNTLATATEDTGNSIKSYGQQALVARLPADFNADGTVNLADYNVFVAEYGKTQSSPADLTKDGTVNLADYNQFVAAYGQTI